MYAEFEVHRTMICDRVRTEAFRRAIDSVVRPGDIVLDVGAGSGILSVFAARAGAARVYAVERTSVAVLAQELAAANGVAEIVQVIHGEVIDVELPERVDVIVSEWLGGFGVDEGMLVPVIVARDRWLKPGGVMIPRLVTAWAALVHDRPAHGGAARPPGGRRSAPAPGRTGDLAPAPAAEATTGLP
jgi:predicted RNA methylase